jgi:hypothetical protein
MPMFEGFRDMKSLWDPVNSTMIRGKQRNTGFTQVQPPWKGKDLCPACLTFIDGVATVEVLQWWRRLDLAESGEL